LSKKFNVASIKDTQVPSMIHHAVQLFEILLKHENIVKSYQTEMLAVTDANTLKQILEEPLGFESRIRSELEILLSLLKDVNSKNDQEPLRIKVYTIQGLLSSPQNKLEDLKKLAPVLSSIVLHSRLVDDLDGLARDHCSLGELFFFFKALQGVLEEALNGPEDQPSACVSFVKVCAQAMYFVHPHCPIEQLDLGQQCQIGSDRFLQMLQEKLDEGCGQWILQSHNLDFRDLDPIHNLDRIRRKRGSADTAHRLPGFESIGKNRLFAPIWDWSRKHNQFFRIVGAICGENDLVVFQKKYCLKELLRESVQRKTRAILRGRVSSGGAVTAPPLPRPSEFLAQINALIRLCHVLSSIIDLDLVSMVKRELLVEVNDPSIGVFGMVQPQLPRDSNREPGSGPDRSLVELVGDWLVYLFDATPFLKGVVFSNARECFLTVTAPTPTSADPNPFRMERFLSVTEVQALVTIIGPYGVLALDNKLQKTILRHATEIKKLLALARPSLQELALRYRTPGFPVVTECRKINSKGLDPLANALLNIGQILALRDMLYTRLHEVLRERDAVSASVCEALHQAYHQSVAVDLDLAPAEHLTKMAGCVESDGDALLRQTLSSLQVNSDDVAVWNVLPIAVAVSCTSSFWKDKEGGFITQMAVHSNNAHCIVKSLAMLTAVFSSATPSPLVTRNPNGVPDAEVRALVQFFEIAAFVVLTLKAGTETEPNLRVPDVIVFLDKVAHEARALHNINLEHVLPHTLVRSTYLALQFDQQGSLYRESVVDDLAHDTAAAAQSSEAP